MSHYPSFVDLIGNTPLFRFREFGKETGATLLGKAEFFNPLSSVKDRIGKAMIEAAESRGELRKGMEILEPTSGNTGIALAFVAAAKGYPLTLTMPETMSLERRTLLILLGAKVLLTPGPLGMKGAIAKAREMHAQAPGKYYTPSQFDNPANPAIHEQSTAREIWEATGGHFSALVSGVGTGGTLTGCGRVFKARDPNIKIFAVEPRESPVIAGGQHSPHKIQGIGAGFVPKNLDRSFIDSVLHVSSDEALETAREVIRSEGVPAGISTGAALHAARELARKNDYSGKTIVVILPSSTERYLSTVLAQNANAQAQALTVQSIDEKFLVDS